MKRKKVVSAALGILLCSTVINAQTVLALGEQNDVSVSDEVVVEVTEEDSAVVVEEEVTIDSGTSPEEPAQEVVVENESEPASVPETNDSVIVSDTNESTIADNAEINTTEVLEESEVVASPMALGVTIDATNFPDAAFRTIVAGFDTDGDGVLSNAEIGAVTYILARNSGITNLTGIKYFTSLTNLNVSGNDLTTIDISGMTSITDIMYDSNRNLQTLDFRNCTSLVSAYHSVYGEVVYISAGMTSYIGCTAINSHTGNIVIDLAGTYTINPDGSKSVDLTTIISPQLIAVFEMMDQPGYDPATKTLTIPSGETTSVYDAGSNNTQWTFYTQLGAVDDVTVTFHPNGGSVVDGQVIAYDSTATEPTPPIREGYIFDGWYADEALTTPWDFTTRITENTNLYAKWVSAINFTVSFESNGGSVVAPQTVLENGLSTEPISPTREGYTFKGWYADAALTIPWNFSNTITQDIILYANWEKNGTNYIVSFESNGGSIVNSQTVLENELAAEPVAPTRVGYTFAGWYLDELLRVPWDFTTPVTSNIILYAKWTPNATKLPTTSTTPKDPKRSNSNTTNKTLPKTGEENNLSNLFGFAILGAITLIYWFKNLKKKFS